MGFGGIYKDRKKPPALRRRRRKSVNFPGLLEGTGGRRSFLVYFAKTKMSLPPLTIKLNFLYFQTNC